MVINLRTVFFVALGIVFIWFLYIERAILTPFILAAIFAYIFNPVVDFFSEKIKFPRTISILLIYALIIAAIAFLSILLTKRIINESSELGNYVDNLIDTTKKEVNNLPDFIRPVVDETLISLKKSKIFSGEFLFVLFPKAISRIVSFLIFLFSAFYFLKEGRVMIDKLLNLVPDKDRIDVEILARKINSVFKGYLRGQIFLVFLVSLILFVALSVIGVRFALILAIFSGFAEIVPIIGPITAGAVAVLVVLITGQSNFSLNPFQAAIIVAAVYFFVRQFQDYFITPYVMGKIVQLHPLLILFAVLAGGHLAGVLGFILAVPIAASIKIILQFFLDRINEGKQIAPAKGSPK